MKKLVAGLGALGVLIAFAWWEHIASPEAAPPAVRAKAAAAVAPPKTPSPAALPKPSASAPATASTGAFVSPNPPRRPTIFGATGPVALADLPDGRFHREIAGLGAAAQAFALAELTRLQIPLNDIDSLHADATGHLFYVCNFNSGAPAGTTAGEGGPARPSFTPDAPATGPGSNPAGLPHILAASASDFAIAVPISSPPVRHSKPGSANVIYLDFNGATVTGTAWNTAAGAPSAYVCLPYDTDGNRGSFSPAEQASIVNIWARVAENYRTFDVDVTTEQPAVYTDRTAHAVITQPTDANGVPAPSSDNASGIAYVGVFGQSNYAGSYAVSFAYQGSYPDAFIAAVISHEVGHNMGLSHDGTQNPDGTKKDEYYSGHGSGPTSWSPIMGAGFGDVEQWSKGEYYAANNPQDDLAIIAGDLGLRADDFADTNAAAAPLIVNGAAVRQAGIVSSAADADRFSFTSGAGSVTLNAVANTSPFAFNLNSVDLVAELYDAAGNLLASSDPPDSPSASVTATLAAGTYFLRIHNTGVGTPLASPPSGYTAYGSIGGYTVTGTVMPAAAPTPAAIVQHPVNDTEFPGNPATFTVVASGNPATAYAWQRSTNSGGSWTALTDGATDSGTATATLTVTGITTPMSGDQYRCVVTNSAGSATSTAATLTVQTPPPAVLPVFGGTGIPIPTFGRGLPAGTSQNLTFTLAAGSDPLAYQWRRNGVDIPGANGLYYFVRNWQVADAGVYTVVATNSLGSVTSQPYTQYISPEGGWSFVNPAPSGNLLTRIDFINGRFLAGGLRGTLLVSTDGYNWTTRNVPASNNLYSFAYINGLYVALGSLGAVFTSPDTVAWTPRNAGTNHQDSSSGLQSLAAGGSRLVAVGIGGITTTSTDGINWTPGYIVTGDDLNGVTYGFGRFQAVSSSDGLVYSSVDGRAWTSVPSSTNSLSKIAFGAGRLVAVGSGGVISVSADGTNWTAAASGTSNTLIGVDFVNGRFIATGVNGTILTSPDGSAWTMANTSGNASNIQNAVYGNGVYLAAGQSGTPVRALLSSFDGATWSETLTGAGAPGISLRGVATSGPYLAAVGTGGTVLQGSSGSGWIQRLSGTSNQLNDVAYGGGQFVAVGNSGTVANSAYGATWTGQTALTTGPLNGVTWGNSLWVAVGTGGGTAKIYSSTTGTGGSWSQRYSGGSAALNKVEYGNGLFVAVGDGGTIATSTNGTAWSAVSSGTTANLAAVTWGGGLHVAVGAGVVLTSTNGTTWTNHPFTPDTLTSVLYANGWFIATGPGSTYYVSADGTTWTGRFTGAWDALNDLVLSNNQVIGVGDDSVILAAGLPVIGTSPVQSAVAFTPVTLVGSVSASPVPVDYQWQKGGTPVPGATAPVLTLASPVVADSGAYTLVATSGFGSVTGAATQLTVNPAAQTIAFAGPADQPFSATPIPLSAIASSGLPVEFSIVAGPATATGSTLTLTGTGAVSVRASQPGNANYAAAPAVDRSFNVLSGFTSWQQAAFSAAELANPAKSGPTAVYGHDGLPNLVKYALGLDPKVDATGSALPATSATANDWVYTYAKPTAVTDVTCAVEVSTDLLTWTPPSAAPTLVSSINGIDTWQATYPRSGTTRIFFRLLVTQ